ncbi:MAG: 50S ribosomal protein L9 [Caldilineaceae bacterium]|nr:50S ribosomal protein L9 [Caldilineaceae bacterium]
MARMNVLLTQDVDNVGLAGEIHSVAGGYARNYLMPRGLAMLATKGALKQAEEIRQAGIRRRAQLRANAEAQAALINGKKLLFTANAGENDRLYGSVTSAEVAAKLEEAVEFEIDRRKIQLHQPLRTLGLYDVEIRLMYEVTATFQVAVVREGENWDAAVARAAVLAAEEKAEAEAAVAAEAAAAELDAETDGDEPEEADE